MKNMRTVATAVTVIMSTLFISQTAGAEINRISSNDAGNEWSVSGSFKNVSGTKAAVQILKPGKTVNDVDPYAYTTEFPVDENGNFNETFVLNGESGEYMFRIGTSGQIFEKNFIFINTDEKEEYIKAVNAAKSAEEIENIFEKDYGRLKNICKITINSEDKQTVYNSLYEAVPKGGFAAFNNMKRCVYEIVLLNDFMTADRNKEEKLEALFEYFDDTASPAMNVWNNDEYTGDRIRLKISDVLQTYRINSISDLQENFIEQTILLALTDSEASNGRKIGILKIVGPTIGAGEYNYFSGLTESKKASILSGLSNSYPSLSKYADAFDKAVKAYRNSKDDQTSGGGLSGGAGMVSKPPQTPNATNPPQKNNNAFSDIDNYSWAKQSIEKLFYGGIIKGKSDGVYAPGDSVKREEFTLMIVKALGFENPSAVFDGFDDVNKSDWYYSSVAAAVEKNIIKGISETEFGSGRYITRQDMALICKNAAEAAGITFDNSNEFTVVNSYEYANTEVVAFSDQSEIADYASEAVLAMQKAGIVQGNQNGEFNPTDSMTRAEAAVVTDRLMKLISGKNDELVDKDKTMINRLHAFGMYDDTQKSIANELTRGEAAKLLCGLLNIPSYYKDNGSFLDCGKDNEYSPYIYAVCDMGYMSGENGKFGSDDFLSYDEAVKLAAAILGEGKTAENKGGYVAFALQKGILDDVEKTSMGMITKRNFLKIFDNLLDKEVLLTDVSDSDTPKKNKTFLNLYHGICEDKGMITANADAGICGENNANKGYIKIGNRMMANINEEYDSYIGRNVIYWYRDNNGEEELVYLEQRKNSNIMSITSDQIDEFKNMEYTYTPEGSKYTKKIKITSKANYIFNNKTIYDYTDEQLSPKSGVITFVDSDGDGKYTEKDTVIIDSYKHVVVNSINTANEIIYGKYGDGEAADTIRLENMDAYSIKDKHGDTFGLRELREWDVLAVKEAPDHSRADIILIDECYGGKINEISLDGIRLDDKYYEFSPEWKGEMPRVSDDVTIYTDLFNKVAAVRKGIASGAVTSNRDTKSEKTREAVILTRYWLDENGETHFISTYNGGKNFISNKLSDKLQINGILCKYDDAENIIRSNMSKAVILEMNEKDEVSNIITAALPGEDDNRGLWQINYPGESLLYKSDQRNFGNRFIAGDRIFTIPESEEEYGKASQYAFNNASFINDRSYVVDAYTTTLNNIYADAVVYRAPKSASGTYDTDTALVVADNYLEVSDEEDVRTCIRGLSYDIINGTVSSKSYMLAEDAVIVDAVGNIRDDITFDDIEPGDCIRYGMNGKEINTVMIAYDLSESAAPANPGDRSAYGYGGWAYNLTEDETYLSITDGKHPSELDMTTYADGGQYLKSFRIRNSSLVTLVDTRGPKTSVTTGSMKDILTYQKAGMGCSKIFLFSSWQSFITGIVVFVE